MKTNRKHRTNRIGRCLLCCAAGLLLAASPAGRMQASADTEVYTIDPFTGEPIGSESGALYEDAEQTRITVNTNAVYDTEAKMYIYPVGSGVSEIGANVVDGMIVSYGVKLVVPDGVPVALMRDGNEVSFGSEIHTPGNYNLLVDSESGQQRLISFTIVGKKTGLISGYTMPEGFRIDNVLLNGDYCSFTRGYVSMVDEGYYEITYSCDRTGEEYNLTVTVDHTPPALVFEGVEEDGKARGPVTITGYEDGDVVTVLKDGASTYYYGDRLTESGYYTVTAVDDADNVSTYEFTIMIYVDSKGWVFFLILVLVIAAVAAYIIIQRKHLRIR